MGKTVRGIYERGIPASAFQEINGIVALGGNALADAEGLWEEHLRAPDHH